VTEFDGKGALVTGGIGRAAGELPARRGASVMFSGLDPAEVEAAAYETAGDVHGSASA
jgi:NAD(P)-dependent dehydrogenase (short-subunit alcohol dehydrogenase family)